MSNINLYKEKINQLELLSDKLNNSKDSRFDVNLTESLSYYLEKIEAFSSFSQKDSEKKSTGANVSQHELTRMYISDKLEDIATKDDIIRSKDEIIENIKTESLATQEKLESEIDEIKVALLQFLPHKRGFRLSLYFVSLFLFFIFSELFFDIQIIDKFWGSLGLAVSVGFLVMSYFLYLDWNKNNNGI